MAHMLIMSFKTQLLDVHVCSCVSLGLLLHAEIYIIWSLYYRSRRIEKPCFESQIAKTYEGKFFPGF